MKLTELADALEKIDEEAFASLLLELELSHDDGPRQVKKMIIDGVLRISTECGNPVRRSMTRTRPGRWAWKPTGMSWRRPTGYSAFE